MMTSSMPSSQNKGGSSSKPLVLDVDGTFLRTDMLFECFWAGLSKSPLRTLGAAAAHFRRPQALKRKLADIAGLRIDMLPVNSEVAEMARTAQENGREVVLASASDKLLVEALARHHGFSNRIFASDENCNLKGEEKAKALVDAFGEGGFDYAGNEPADRAIWSRADGAVIVGRLPHEVKTLEAAGKTVTELAGGWRKRDLAARAAAPSMG